MTVSFWSWADELAERGSAETAGWGELSFLEKDGKKLIFAGSELAGATYARSWIDADEIGVVLTGNHVTMVKRHGLRPDAPGDGVDDYNAGQAAGIKEMKTCLSMQSRAVSMRAPASGRA